MMTGPGLSDKERGTVLSIASAAAAKEPTNAFWPEMESVFYVDGDQMQKAIDAWIRASASPQWDDYQTARLLHARDEMVSATGLREAWQLAYLYYARSDDVAYVIRSAATAILARADYDTAAGLELRYATLLHGDLLREHAHSSKSSVSAMEIVDLTTYPSDSVSAQYRFRPKTVWAGKIRVLSNLTKVLHQPDWTQRARRIYLNNESWQALTVHDSNDEESEMLALGCVLCSSIASALLVVSAIGAVIWSMGRFVAWRLTGSKNIKPIVAAATALALGGLVELLTGYLPAAIAAALCAAFLTVAPDRSRQARPRELGPLFTFMAVLLGLLFSSLFVAYLIGTTPAANAVLPSLGVPLEYIDKPMLAGLAAVSFGLVFLIAPIWAVVHRLGTPHVLSLILMRYGAFVSVLGLFLSIALGPLAVYADRRLETTFSELVKNEPVHYFIHR
jgi:hypothetical protein